MIDIKKLNELKKIIRLECQFIYSDNKNITKEEIEQKVARHVDEKFPNYINRRQLYEDIRDEMFLLFFTKKGELVGLSDDKDHEKWFDRKLIEDKPFWEIYRQILVEEGKMPIEAINDLDKSTDLILSDLESPLREGGWDRRGMVIGSVQSGKTANFLGLIAKARDAGYKFIVILSGANNDLRQQTQQRIDEGYIGLKTYVLYTDKAKEENRLGLLRRSQYSGKYQTPTTGTIDLITGDFNKSRAVGLDRYIIQKEDFNSYVFVCKKNKSPLTNLIKWLCTLQQCKNPNGAAGFEKIPEKNTEAPPFINDFPLMLIDDECDHYSIDTGIAPMEDGKFLEEHDPTAINGLIRKLLQCFSRRVYVGYTATPFANIYIHDEKIHKDYGEDLFPKSFIYDVRPPENHKGLESIFGENEEEDNGIASENVSHFLIPINDFCRYPNDLFCKEGWIPPKHKSYHIPIYDQNKDPVDDNIDKDSLSFYLKLIEITKNKFNRNINLPPSLIHAIMSFIIACSIRNIRSIQQFHAHKSMLVHVTKFVKPQGIIAEEIRVLFNSILECLKEDNENKDFFHKSLKSIYETYFIKDTVEFNDEKKETINYEKLLHNENGIKFCISEISRNIVKMSGNTSKPDYEDYKNKNGFGLMTIIIGGDKLSRGVTFDGLSTSYFLRSSKMFDTLMQMGRWFGYREGYDDVCRLYTSADLLDAFVEICVGSEKIRSEIRNMKKLNKTPKDFGLWIQTSPYSHYIPTARNKMRHAKQQKVNYSAWGNQMPTLPWKKETVLNNFKLTSNFIEKLKKPDEIDIKRDWGKNKVRLKKKLREKDIKIFAKPSYYWKNVDHKIVEDYLSSFAAHEASKFQPKEMAEYIKNAVKKKNMLTNWNVALIGNGSSGLMEKIGGKEVNLAFRKPKNTFTDDKAAYGVIWDPNHEALDIDKKKYQEANKEVYSENNEESNAGIEARFTKVLREKRSNKNGLLLIYPILPMDYKSVPRLGENNDPISDFNNSWIKFKENFKLEKDENLLKIIKERKAIISIAASFPKTSEDLATNVYVNNVYVKLREEEEGRED